MSLVAAAVEGSERLPFEAIVISVIIVLNGILDYVQDAPAETRVARVAADCGDDGRRAARDGREERGFTTSVVPGDVLLPAEGDAVAGDAWPVHAASLTPSSTGAR